MKKTVLIVIAAVAMSLILVAILFSFACNKKPIDTYENNLNTNSLIGNWREIYPCKGCSSLTFSDNDTIYHQFTYDNSIVKLTYQFISEDSIQIVRLEETNPNKRMTNNKIVFYNSDSILIEKFTPTDAAIYPPQFIDIKLKKTE